jgi:hypothetical protein
MIGLSVDLSDGSESMLILILFISILLLVIIFGQNLQGWWAARQIYQAIRRLRIWRNQGISLIRRQITKTCPSTLTAAEIDEFVQDLLEMFVIPPAELATNQYHRLHFLLDRRQKRLREYIIQFLPGMVESNIARLLAILQITIEFNSFAKKAQHDLILGSKMRSYLYFQQAVAELTQIMYTASAYAIALKTFMKDAPIGDSIGVLAVKEFIREVTEQEKQSAILWTQSVNGLIIQEVECYKIHCVCMRAQGPYNNVGQPGEALQEVLKVLESQQRLPTLILLIDSYLRLEGETSGTVAQGIGAAIGDGPSHILNKFQIETIALEHNPVIPIESIVCKESLHEAVSPISEAIKNAIPKILRILRKILHSQVKIPTTVIIMGIGNGLGIDN